MINSDKYFTIIYKDLTVDERRNLLENSKVSASGYSHAFDDRDGLLSALVYLEDYLATKLMDHVPWSNKEELQKEIADIQKLMKKHGRVPKNRPDSVEKTMESKHPINPPPELLEQWLNLPLSVEEQLEVAARWGTDQRLEEIIHWLVTGPYGASIAASAPNLVADLRAACRPKVPTLKEKVLDILGSHGDLSPEEHSRIADILEDSLRD